MLNTWSVTPLGTVTLTFVATEVSKRVNVVGNDDAACLAPPETTPAAEMSTVP